MTAMKFSTTFLTCFLLWICHGQFGGAMECGKGPENLRLTFNCPTPFEDSNEIFCCGPNDNQYCCDFKDFLGDLGPYAIAIIVAIVIVSLAIIISVLFCICRCLRG